MASACLWQNLSSNQIYETLIELNFPNEMALKIKNEMPNGLLDYIKSGNININKLKATNNVYMLNTILILFKHAKQVDFYPNIKFDHLSEETNYDNSFLELDPKLKQIFNEKIPTKVTLKAVKRKKSETKQGTKKQKLDQLSVKKEDNNYKATLSVPNRPLRSISCSPLASLTASPVKQEPLLEQPICFKELTNKIHNIHDLFVKKHAKFNQQDEENVKPTVSRVSSGSSLASLSSSPAKLEVYSNKHVLKESTNTVNNNKNISVENKEDSLEEEEASKLRLLPIGALPLPEFSPQVEQALNMNRHECLEYLNLIVSETVEFYTKNNYVILSCDYERISLCLLYKYKYLNEMALKQVEKDYNKLKSRQLEKPYTVLSKVLANEFKSKRFNLYNVKQSSQNIDYESDY